MTMPSLGHNNSFQDTLESDIRSLKLAQKPSSPCLLHEIASVQGFRGGARQGPGGYMLNGEDTERGIDTMELTRWNGHAWFGGFAKNIPPHFRVPS